MTLWKSLILSCITIIFVLDASAQTDTGVVTLSPTEIVWNTTQYELDDNGAIIPASVDNTQIREHIFNGYILENDYLRVTLLPEYGGRILSIIYKPTGHEQLYQNPLGLPYGIGDGNFYYDWLMVYGGIFPTFPVPEHGKTWFLPWEFEIVTESPEVITIEMSFVDDITFNGAPSRFNSQPTGLEVSYLVTLHATSRALDTEIIISNPTDETVRYEYWTCVTLAPGSLSDDTRVTANAEIIAPIDEVKMPPWWPDTVAQEVSSGVPGIYIYDNLRTFENWADMGIAYAFPTIENSNFWGVINQDNGEGLIRVGDNTVTPGLKIWTWGYESAAIPLDEYSSDERRPYIELWAGVSPEFFTPAFLQAGEQVVAEESYITTVGMSDITHAGDTHLANIYRLADTIEIEIFAVDASLPATLAVINGDDVIEELAISATTDTAQSFSITLPDSIDDLTFTLIDDNENTVLSGNIASTLD